VRPDRLDRITPSDLGHRVVVRYRLPAEGRATDVLGRLDAWDDGTLSVRRADGSRVEVPAGDVIAAKPVPTRPLVRREVRDLEAAAATGWRALETAHLGGWMLRAAGGFTGRANSCLPLSSPDRPLADAVHQVERWYGARNLAPAFQLPDSLGQELDEHLDLAGWPSSTAAVLVMTAPAEQVAAARRTDRPEVVIAAEPDDAWLAIYRGGDLPAVARRVLVNAAVVGFASVDDGDQRLAIGRGAVTGSPAGRCWLGITGVEVAPEVRRQGLGTKVMAELARWGTGHGATDVYLQVAEQNTAAVAAYERLGFTEHHRYHYRRLVPQPRS
jgi:N-acetylglutamate synthase